MKHLRRYNESNSEGLTEEDIQDFCEINLAYLLDDGLRVLVGSPAGSAYPTYWGSELAEPFLLSSEYKVTLSFRRVINKKWIEIKDQIIPFLTHLRNVYNLAVEVGSMRVPTNIRIEMIGPNCTYPDWFNIEDIISDKIVPTGRLNDDYKVLTIQFKIEGKKE